MVFPGLKGAPDDAIVSFLAETQAALKPYGTYLGASVFGVAATRPTRSPRTSRRWPSTSTTSRRWSTRRTGRRASTASPTRTREPYEIVQRSLEDFKKDVRGTGARVVPWLQDFSLGVHYGPAQVAAADPGGEGRRDRRVPALGPAGHVHRRGAHPGCAHRPSSRSRRRPAELAKSLKPNELGLVPVLMHHQIRAHGSVYDMTAAQLRSRADAPLAGRLLPDHRRRSRRRAGSHVPKGRSPVVLTFDDATNNQVAFRPDGSLDPSSGLGVLEAFAKTHHDFPAAATFYVPRNAFDGNGRTPASTLSWLVEHGFELGNHTKDHIPLNTLGPDRSPAAARARQPRARRPAARATSRRRWRCRSAPCRSRPRWRCRGSWGGHSYSFAGVFLAGAEPAPSPFSTKWDPDADPADPDEPELERLARLHRRACGSTCSSGTRACATSRTATRRRSRSRAGASRSSRRRTGTRAKPY